MSKHFRSMKPLDPEAMLKRSTGHCHISNCLASAALSETITPSETCTKVFSSPQAYSEIDAHDYLTRTVGNMLSLSDILNLLQTQHTFCLYYLSKSRTYSADTSLTQTVPSSHMNTKTVPVGRQRVYPYQSLTTSKAIMLRLPKREKSI